MPRGGVQPRVPSWEHQKKKGHSPVLICPKCHAVYFDKHWHSHKLLSQAYGFNKQVDYKLCPEDSEDKVRGGFEGEVVLRGIPKNKLNEIVRQIRNIGKRAQSRDPEDKILKIEITGKKIRVLLTENQLATSIGKQIAKAHKGGRLEIQWSHKDKPVRVYWDYK